TERIGSKHPWIARDDVHDEAVLSRVVEVDCDRLGVVDVVVLEDAPDFLRARLHAVDVDHVVDSPEMPIVAIAQTFHLVSVSPKSFSVWSFRDAVVVLFVVVVIQQLGRDDNRWWHEEQFSTGDRLAVVSALDVYGEGWGR